MRLQMEKVNPDGVMSSSYLSDRFPTVLTKMSPTKDIVRLFFNEIALFLLIINKKCDSLRQLAMKVQI